MSTFAVLQTPVTSAPNDLAICTANVPTPPDAPFTSTLLYRLNVSLVAKALQRGEGRHRYGSRLLERDVIRLHDQYRLGSANILGKGPLPMNPDFGPRSLRVIDTHAEHFVAGFELLYVPASRFNDAGHVDAWPAWFRDRRLADPERDAKDVRHGSQ